MTNREWIQGILEKRKDLPVPQQWMGFFNAETARKLTPAETHYSPMWLFDLEDDFNTGALGPDVLEGIIKLNNYTDRCMACPSRGSNICFGHGAPGEFGIRVVERNDNGLIVEYETGVLAKIQYNPHFYHSYNHPVKTKEDLKNFVLPDPADPVRYAGFAEDVNYLKSKGEYVLGSLNGFYSALHYFVMDYENTLMALLLDQELVQTLLEMVGEWNLTAAKKMIEAGADCIAFCDDLGNKQSMMMSPEQYRQFFKPWHKKLCNVVHDAGGKVHIHSHGAITPILDDFVDCGFDFVNPFDPEEGFDIEHVLKKYSEHFVVVGGLPTSFWEWEIERQEQYIEKLANLGKKYSRLIFMDSGGVPESVTPELFSRISEFSRKARGVSA